MFLYSGVYCTRVVTFVGRGGGLRWCSSQYSHNTRRKFLHSWKWRHMYFFWSNVRWSSRCKFPPVQCSACGAQAEHKPADALNEYLQSRDTSPVRSRLNTPWEIASERTKRYYIRKAGQGVTAIMEDIAPKSPAELFQAVCSLQAIQRTLWSDEETETTVDETLLGALADCYHAAGCRETRRQILSIMADKVSFKKLRLWIPDLSCRLPRPNVIAWHTGEEHLYRQRKRLWCVFPLHK